jgi:hypothetical protein
MRTANGARTLTAARGVPLSSIRCRRGAALQERAVVGRITRSRPKPKPKFVHEVSVGHWEVDEPWLAELVARVAGPAGFKKRTPFWAYTIFSFVHQEQADEIRLYVGRRREAAARLVAKKGPCPVTVKYAEAAFFQYAVIWGLSTGVLREVVRVYRRQRSKCSTHGLPRAVAAHVIVAAAPAIEVERAREMVDAMLTWAIARHRTWFWAGLEGDRVINRL